MYMLITVSVLIRYCVFPNNAKCLFLLEHASVTTPQNVFGLFLIFFLMEVSVSGKQRLGCEIGIEFTISPYQNMLQNSNLSLIEAFCL